MPCIVKGEGHPRRDGKRTSVRGTDTDYFIYGAANQTLTTFQPSGVREWAWILRVRAASQRYNSPPREAITNAAYHTQLGSA